MNSARDIRESGAVDTAAILALYGDAFPEEDLVPLVRVLLAEAEGAISLVAVSEDNIAGYICFTVCRIEAREVRAVLLGPLAVSSARQGQGIGSDLVRTGLQRMEAIGVALVCVLGDPRYYSRFAFKTETRVLPPHPIPEVWREAWQSIRIGGLNDALAGKLMVIPPWRDPALWGP